MKKQLNYILGILFLVVMVYLVSPSKETTDKLWVLKGITLAGPYKVAVNNYWNNHKTLPTLEDWEKSNNKIAVDTDKTAVESIVVGEDAPGAITIVYNSSKEESAPPEINGTRIVLTPQVMNDQITWTCKGTMPIQILPKNCL